MANDTDNTLFFIVWRNVVLQNNILHFLRLYNNHYFKRLMYCNDFISHKTMEMSVEGYYAQTNTKEPFKHLEYLRSIKLYSGINNMFFGDFNNTLQLIQSNYPNIKELYLYGEYEKQLTLIPSSITSLSFDDLMWYNESFEHLITPNLKSLSFKYSTPIIKIPINNTLTYLNLGDSFNSPLRFSGILDCNSLVTLKFGNSFNFPVPPNTLPLSILNLSFGNSFAHDKLQVDSIPPLCESISFGDSFSADLIMDGVLPESLKSIKFSNLPNHNIPKLPNSKLIKLSLNSNKVYDDGSYNIPSNLINFKSSKSLPSNLNQLYKLLKLNLTNVDLKYIFSTEQQVPNSVTKLVLSSDQFINHNFITSNLVKLEIDSFHNSPVEHDEIALLSNLKSLIVHDIDNMVINENTFPIGLIHLSIGKHNNQIPIGVLPKSIESLSLRLSKLNSIQDVKGRLPSNLKVLSLKSSPESYIILSFNSTIDWLPPSVRTLILLDKISVDSHSIIPNTIESIYVDGTKNIGIVHNMDIFNQTNNKIIKVLDDINILKIYKKYNRYNK